MTDTKDEQSTTPGSLTRASATALRLLVLLPIFALMLLLALWAAVFCLLPTGHGDAIAYWLAGAAASVFIVAFIALLMFEGHRLRRSALADKAFQAILMDTRNDRAFLQSLIDHLPVLVYVRDMRPGNAGRMVVWNKTAELVTGYPIDDVLSKSNRAVFPEKMVDAFDAFEQKMRDNPAVIDIPDIAFQRPDGGLRFLHTISVPLFDDANQLEYILGIAEDITSRRQQDLELRTKQAELTAANDASPLGLFRTGPKGECTYVNRTYEEISGLTRDQALGDGWAQAIHPEDRLKVFQAWGQSARDRQPYQGVYRFRHADGRIVWVSVKTAPILLDGIAQGYVGSVDDITARREAEQALRQSEARLRTITDTLPAMVAYVDADERYRFNNVAYERTFGIAREAMKDKPMREILGEAMYSRVKPYIDRVLRGETVTFELDEQRDEHYSCAELIYIPQFSDDGRQVVGFHVMIQDVTAKKLEERRLVQLAQIDSLTGLANRAGFQQKLADAMARSRTARTLIAVMYLDIDNFKPINDTYGHEVGDVLLKAFAARLSNTLRSTDTIARLGGDEFTIVMEELGKPVDAENVAAKIVQSMQAPFELNEISASISVSIGLAFYQGGMLEPKTLIKQADEMLYRAKEEGRNTYRVAPIVAR